ncbi:MAG: hypothetical protein KAV82_15975 [Phycisphaerae bacterium]|nr:hypothetical protein [Phycisphaerae bacterium]
MNAKARRALGIARQCVAAERIMVLPHFTRRMDKRGLVWPEVLVVLDDPEDVRDGGLDHFDRPKWIVSGTAADGLGIEFVCVLDKDEHGNITVFITID